MAITLSVFRTRVAAYTDVGGQAYLTATADVNPIVGERLRSFTKITRCLYSEDVKFTPTAARATYALLDPPYNAAYASTFAIDPTGGTTYTTYVGIESVRRVWWGAGYLNDYSGRSPKSVRDMRQLGYLKSVADGVPGAWWQTPGALTINPAPTSGAITDATSGTNTIRLGAFYIHPNVLSSSIDATSLLIPDHLLELAATWVAVGLLRPSASGSLQAKVSQMQAECNVAMGQERSSNSESMEFGPRNPYAPSSVRLTY